MAPIHTTGGSQGHYPIISSVAPAHTTDGPHKSEYSTGMSLKKIITTLRPLREFTGRVSGQDITFTPEVPTEVETMLNTLQKS